jgi:outer membrane lipoprotein-sorting protein
MRMVLLLAALVVLTPCPAVAEDVPTVPSVLAALTAAPEQPDAYKASVALHVRMRMFPFIRMTLHGDSWYKRPGLYRFVFRGVPFVAKAFSDMKYDLGDPARWSDRYEVTFAPGSTDAAPVLRLTPKTHALVKTLDVAVDPQRGRILRATWSRTDGGTIALVQTYAPGADGHAVVAKQLATIDLPRMKAELEADYADFAPENAVGIAP